MKTMLTLATFTISGLFSIQSIHCQSIDDKAYSYNASTPDVENQYLLKKETEVKSESKKDDVVINMEIIESFRRSDSKLQSFSLADFFRSDPSNFSIKYLAYIRVRLNNTQDNLENALTVEMENINTEIKNNTKLNTSVAFSEDKVKEQPKLTEQQQQTSGSKEQTHKSEKEKSKILKWTHLKK